ncbi:MAG TPA: bifunctional aldolase/short-chain dehydrogenase [Candidatus Omnitrophica bacterium]|nr:MAG: short-chain dehydrogenase [Omnitrophica WOR_2 bacterium GWA2_45_18]HBR15337.1 bifunctional aldolase/short-chain dehydrogenase [Candidatus Omnitrophota bacterium]
MKSLWKDNDARLYQGDPLQLRVYTSRLLGKESSLVLHGGGNTSVKVSVTNMFAEPEELLLIKGSGWDLATIEAAGFAPVKLDVLKKMVRLNQLSDTEMVRLMRSAMTNPNAPTPSVEAILHAIIPLPFVDHTHADSLVTLTNTPHGEKRIREIYDGRLMIIPYVMPGFVLAKKVYEMTKDLDFRKLEGMVLMHHGLFTFGDDARSSYERMIGLVDEAEAYLKKHHAGVYGMHPRETTNVSRERKNLDLVELARLRLAVSKAKGAAMLACVEDREEHIQFSSRLDAEAIATRGPLTPDHVIRTKRVPMIVGSDVHQDVLSYQASYQEYFKRHMTGSMMCLDPAPRWAVWPGVGTVSFGSDVKDVKIVGDIVDHTILAIQAAEVLGGWSALPEKDIFDVEYWELEQAKLKKGGTADGFQGKVALVTGAASGIGRACVEVLHAQGAAVAALDINPKIETLFNAQGILGVRCDVTHEADLEHAVAATARRFGGLDILVCNAGIFPESQSLTQMDPDTWDRSLRVNLSSHQRLLKACIPFLVLGIDPAVIIIGSKNVPAPGPGAGAYSAAKAGLTQLGRVAALELASDGVRVNMIHPNQVFDTEIWTPEVLEKRAQYYQMTVEEYKKNNLLKVEITSKDVALLVSAMAGPVFSKTTGAQVTIDGGNDRVI